MRPANERRRYNVTSPLTGWAHTQNDPCICIFLQTVPAHHHDHMAAKFCTCYIIAYFVAISIRANLYLHEFGQARCGLVTSYYVVYIWVNIGWYDNCCLSAHTNPLPEPVRPSGTYFSEILFEHFSTMLLWFQVPFLWTFKIFVIIDLKSNIKWDFSKVLFY